MATEALRRLREEIDAAFDAPRRSIREPARSVSRSSKKAPKWGEVTALLASVTSSVRSERVPTCLRPVKAANGQVLLPSRHLSRRREMTTREKQALLRKLVAAWRRQAQVEAVVTRAFTRQRKRRELRLVRETFQAWRGRADRQMWWKMAARSVERKVALKVLALVWQRWTSQQQRRSTIRELQFAGRRRWCGKVFEMWVQTVRQWKRNRRDKEVARCYLLRRHWRRIEAGLVALRRLDGDLERFVQRRMKRVVGDWFTMWVEYVEQCKCWQFAVQWKDRRVVGNAYDAWREVHARSRFLRHTLQLASRRRRRRVFRTVLRCWLDHVGTVHTQRQALGVVLRTQQRRQTFMHLAANARHGLQREDKLQRWKTRRVIWTWLDHSHQHRMLRLRAEFLKENCGRLTLQSAAWRPWRRVYLHSVALRTFADRCRAHQLKRIWFRLISAIHQQKKLDLITKHIVNSRRSRGLRCAVTIWRGQVNATRHRKNLSATSVAFHCRKILEKAISCWKATHEDTCTVKYLDVVAVKYLSRKMVQHWARWAYWNKRELASKLAAVIVRRRQHRLQRCISRWKEIIFERHRALRFMIFATWKVAVALQQRERHLLDLCRTVQLRWRWQWWVLLLKGGQRLRAITSRVENVRKRRLMRHSLVTVWLRKTRRYCLGSRILRVFAERHLLSYALVRWRKRQLHLVALRHATVLHSGKLQARYLYWWFSQTIGHKRTAIAHSRRHLLMLAWRCWDQFFRWRRRRHEADANFRRYLKQRAVRSMRVATATAKNRRNQLFEADAWHEAVVMQSVLSKWLAAAKHARQCQIFSQRLSRHTVGRRALIKWHDARIERQQSLKAVQFYSTALVWRSWNALLRVTKRHQVALVMWSHAMARIRLERFLVHWKRYVQSQRGQNTLADTMQRMLQRRIRQKFFSAWALLITARVLASRRHQRESQQWSQACWFHWKLWRVSSRWQHSQQHVLLRTVFHQGLRRHAIQQQAAREVCVYTARGLLHRSLARWRVEWWLIRTQKKLSTEIKRKALSLWREFVAACRQKRRWEHYVQQLHRSQTQCKPVTSRDKRIPGVIFRDTRALQAQLKRYRVLMTHVLHAWYLVAHSRHRHTRSRVHSIASSRKVRPHTVAEFSSSCSSRRMALEFWARRVTRRCFVAWRKSAANEKVVHLKWSELEPDATMDPLESY